MPRLATAARGAGLLLALMAGSGHAAQNWATTTDDAAADPAFDASKAICRAAGSAALPTPPGPPAAAGCSSEELYYGIGRPADPAAARACAMVERAADPDNEQAFGGAAMLMTIFANGQGGPRGLGLATALACTLSGAPAEMDGRVRHLAALAREGTGEPFGFCDDVTSGLYIGACSIHESSIAAVERNAAFVALATAWTPEQRTAFPAVRTAMEAFAAARALNEIDSLGTAHAAFMTEAADAVRDDFRDLLRGLATAATPTPLSTAGEDKALNVAYTAVMQLADPQWGTPTKAGIKATQRLWLTYRDALAGFVRAVYGPAQADAVVAALTHRRTNQLREFLG